MVNVTVGFLLGCLVGCWLVRSSFSHSSSQFGECKECITVLFYGCTIILVASRLATMMKRGPPPPSSPSPYVISNRAFKCFFLTTAITIFLLTLWTWFNLFEEQQNRKTFSTMRSPTVVLPWNVSNLQALRTPAVENPTGRLDPPHCGILLCWKDLPMIIYGNAA